MWKEKFPALIIPVELRQWLNGIARCSDCQLIRDDVIMLFLHPIQGQTVRMHHQLHDHPAFLQIIYRLDHLAL